MQAVNLRMGEEAKRQADIVSLRRDSCGALSKRLETKRQQLEEELRMSARRQLEEELRRTIADSSPESLDRQRSHATKKAQEN